MPVAVAMPELIRQGQEQHDQGGLIFRIGLQDVQAYAFGQRGLGQQPVPFCFFEGFLNAGLRNRLEFELHGHGQAIELRNPASSAGWGKREKFRCSPAGGRGRATRRLRELARLENLPRLSALAQPAGYSEGVSGFFETTVLLRKTFIERLSAGG